MKWKVKGDMWSKYLKTHSSSSSAVWPCHIMRGEYSCWCWVTMSGEYSCWVVMCGEYSCWVNSPGWWVQLLSEWPCMVSTAAEWVAMCGEYSYWVSGHVLWVQLLLSEWPWVVGTAAEWVTMCGEYNCWVSGHVWVQLLSEWSCVVIAWPHAVYLWGPKGFGPIGPQASMLSD